VTLRIEPTNMCQRGLVSALPFALLLALVAQVSAASPCNDLSIEEEGILCDEVDGECKCGRPCDVYKSNVFKACSALAVKQVGLCVPTGYCDNAWDERNLLRPMSSGLLADEVTQVDMITKCTAMNCEDPSSPDQNCVDKSSTFDVTDVRTPTQCGCEDHPDYNVQMSGRAIVEGDRKLLLGAFLDAESIKFQYEMWDGPICDRVDLDLLCPLKIEEDYYKGWTLFLSSPTCNSRRFIISKFKTANPTLERFTGAGRVETSEDVDLDIGSEITFSIKWIPMKENDWLGCGTQCIRSAAGTSTTIPTSVHVVAFDPSLFSYSVALYDPSQFENGVGCYGWVGAGSAPILSRDVAAGDEQGVTFVLKDGKHVIEVILDGWCFYNIITVSGSAQARLYVEDLFESNYGEFMNVVVLGNYSAYTTRPHPASIEYAIYDANECPGPYYDAEFNMYETDPPYECQYSTTVGPLKYGGADASEGGGGCVTGGSGGNWHALLSGSYVLQFSSWGYQDVWIPFNVANGEIVYMQEYYDWWWMEWGWYKYMAQIFLPHVTSIDLVVTNAETWYAVFAADDDGSFAYIDASYLDNTQWSELAGAGTYLERDAGSFVIYYWSDGYMYSWYYFDVWWSESLELPSVTFVNSLAAGQVQFVMQWRYQCTDQGVTCYPEDTTAPCENYEYSDSCRRWGSKEVDTLIMPSTDDWDGSGYAYWASPSISSGDAVIEFDEEFATGGFSETTRFTDLFSASTTEEQNYTCWVNSYAGADEMVSSSGFAPNQVEISVYCGPDTCEDSKSPGNPLPEGRIYSAVLPDYASYSFWWKSGTLKAGGSHGSMVSWQPCLDIDCAVFAAQDAPVDPFDMSRRVSDGGAWMSSYITGLYANELPAESSVTFDFYHKAIGEYMVSDFEFAQWKDAMFVLTRGDYRGTYKADGYTDHVFDFTVAENYYGREDLTLEAPFFIPSLAQGQVRMIMTWQYDCSGSGSGASEDGGITCESPQQPLLNYDGMTGNTRGGADEVDTLIMPTVSDWSGEGYAYWDSSNIESGQATIEFDADFATGGYSETTLFTDLHLANTPLAEYQCWTHAYSGLDGCNAACDLVGCDDQCDHSLAYNQVKVRIVCGPDTCVDSTGTALNAGVIYTSTVPEGVADIEANQYSTGIYWWMPGKVSALASGKVEWIPCVGEPCKADSDDDAPYLFGGLSNGRIVSFADHVGPQDTTMPAMTARRNSLPSRRSARSAKNHTPTASASPAAAAEALSTSNTANFE